jgi:5-amino-6-(5-phosphoribosylamino)uracil reductase
MLHTTAILAMSADGKLTDYSKAPSSFVSKADQDHLEAQIAIADAVLFGAGTLRAYGTTMTVKNAELLQQRQARHQPEQPLQIVCSKSADLETSYPFFTQETPRGLLTNAQGADRWRDRPEFDLVLAAEQDPFDWRVIFGELENLGIQKLALLGGGQLAGSIFDAGLVNELWLTVCPLILGNPIAPTPVAGQGFLIAQAPQLELIESVTVQDEVFIHYRVKSLS